MRAEAAAATAMEREILGSGVLIIDDEPMILRLMERVLRAAGFERIWSTTDAAEGVTLFRDRAPDIVVLDLHMPGMDGFAVMEALREHTAFGDFRPVLVLSADLTADATVRALSSGARDFLTKPVRPAEITLRLRNLLETRVLYRQVRSHAEQLEERVQERTAELEEARNEVMERLARAAEFRDDETGHHTHRVGELAGRIATRMGWSPAEVEVIRRAAPLHDVGKIALPDGVLLKAGPLNPHELEIGRRHTTIGADLLAGSRHVTLQMAADIALCHHERWDGGGYPEGLRGEEIPLCARIVAVADVYDALMTERPYKPAWEHERALAEIRAGSGSHFDAAVVEAFLSLFRGEANQPLARAPAG